MPSNNFEILDMPSGGVLIKGRLIQKKLTAKSKRLVMLCFPQSIEDVQMLYEHLKLTNKDTGEISMDMQEELSRKDMEIYGHLALASISGRSRVSYPYRISSLDYWNFSKKLHSLFSNPGIV